MLRLAARYADQWDTFAAMPDTATDGVETALAERIRYLDEACRSIGRDPAEIRRSTWTTASALSSEAAYLDFVTRHRELGFTDFSTVMPAVGDLPVLRRVAENVIPELRAALV
jgi:Luciferase-like monooxygenase.